MSSYEMTFEERRIAMLAIAGFTLTDEDRATIRPLYMRILTDDSDAKPGHVPVTVRRTAQDVVIDQVVAERKRQDQQWGGAGHDDEHNRGDWLQYIKEHRDRAAKVAAKPDDYRHRLIVIAALAIAAVESHDRRQR